MRAKFSVICLLGLVAFNISATPLLPEYQPKGLAFFSSISLDNIFKSSNKYFTLDVLELSFYPSSDIITTHVGVMTQFSAHVSLFDLYTNMGMTIYPFGRILSISGNFGINHSLFLLNHFAYLVDIKINLDIPIYLFHHISLGAGVRHRNAMKMINWMKLKDEYFNIYNSYFFEIGYRWIFR